MKILAIVADINLDNLGGAEMHFVNVLKEIAGKVGNVTVLVGPSDSIKEDFRQWPNVDFVTVNYPHVPNLFGIMFILFATPKAILLAMKNKYDLIWAKQEYPQTQVGAVVKSLLKLPLYVTSQNAFLHKEEYVLKGNWPKIIRDFLPNLITPLMAVGFKLADIVATVSSYSAEAARQFGAKSVVIIPNGTSIPSGKLPVVKKQVVLKIVTTSWLIPRNGIDTLIEACTLLPNNIPWQLTIAGDGPIADDLKELVKTNGVEKKVKFLGRVPNSQVASLLKENCIFVRPSRAEGFGASFVEAMSRGLVCIGTPVGGIVDFLKNEETGLLVPVDSPQKLAEGMTRLWKDKKLHQRLRLNAWKLVKEKYSWEKIGKQVLSAFKLLLKGK